MDDPGVTIIVPTLNRGGFLLGCLKDLVAQNYRPLEILIVDQSEILGEDVARLIDDHRSLIVHHRVSFRGLPQARNHGWRHAKHEHILFVDDDIRCGPDLASEHLRELSIPGIGLVAGGIDTPSSLIPDLLDRPGIYYRWTATPARGFAGFGETEADHAAGCNFSVKRRALLDAGGFDEVLAKGAALYEETDLCLRVKRSGYRVRFNGKARLTHLVAPGGGCRVTKPREYVEALAHNRALMIRRHGRWFHAPVAIGRLAMLGLSYARHYKTPSALSACLKGGIAGMRAGGRNPIPRSYRAETAT